MSDKCIKPIVIPDNTSTTNDDNPCGPHSKCNKNRHMNMFFVRRQSGRWFCHLDTIKDEDLIYLLSHNRDAKKHLLAITDDPHFVELANSIQLVHSKVQEADYIQHREITRAIPYYYLVGGKVNGN